MSDHVLVFGEVKHITDKAILLVVSDDGEEKQFWLPKSQVDDADDVAIGDTELYVTAWFRKKMEM